METIAVFDSTLVWGWRECIVTSNFLMGSKSLTKPGTRYAHILAYVLFTDAFNLK